MAALKTVALHEAAHAVVARVLGQPVKLASLDSVLTRHRRGDSKAHRQQAIVALVGPAAEDRLCRHTREERAQLWATVWRIDLANAVGHVDASGGGAMAPVKRAAERLVRRHWNAIERVAVALSQRAELSGDEVDALLLGTDRR